MSETERVQAMNILDSIQVAACMRCGAVCRVADTSNPDARLLRHATAPGGLCPDCGMTQFLQSVSTLGPRIEQNGVGCLLDPRFQEQMTALLAAGHADATPAELHWQRIVDNWSLPFPTGTRKSRNP